MQYVFKMRVFLVGTVLLYSVVDGKGTNQYCVESADHVVMVRAGHVVIGN